MRTHRLFLILSLGLIGPAASSQPVIAPGTRVRVWLPDTTVAERQRTAIVGRVASIDARTLIVLGDELQNHPVPLSSILQVDSSTGRPSRRVAGAVVGGVLSGAAFVGVICGFSNGSCSVNKNNVSGFLGYYTFGAIPGVFIGRSIGGRMQGNERWRTVWPR